jgi:hypothetical protein
MIRLLHAWLSACFQWLHCAPDRSLRAAGSTLSCTHVLGPWLLALYCGQ